MKKMRIHYDAEGDFLEVSFAKPQASYYDHLGDDVFERRSEQSGGIIGYAIFNVRKRGLRRDLEVIVPVAS